MPQSITLSRLARAACLVFGAHVGACAVDVADMPAEEEVVATSQGLYFISVSASSEWIKAGQWDAYTNWEQDVTIAEQGIAQITGIEGAIDGVSPAYWRLFISTVPPNGKYYLEFALDRAVGAQPPPGGSCRNRSCRIEVPDPRGQTVRLMLIKSNRTDGADRWWSAWALIRKQGYYIGQLQAPADAIGRIDRAWNMTSGWAEQPGDGTTGPICPNPPLRTVVGYGPPTVSSPQLFAHKLAYRRSFISNCAGPGKYAGPFYDGALHIFGP